MIKQSHTVLRRVALFYSVVFNCMMKSHRHYRYIVFLCSLLNHSAKHNLLNSPFCLPYLSSSHSPPDANGNHPPITFSIKVKPALLLAQPYPSILKTLLGNVEAWHAR